MAQRRMFSLDVVDTDIFLEMPSSAQNLYFHLGLRADDDGFVSSPKRITTLVNCSPDDLKLLIAKGFIIPFDSGVCVIRDWRQNNYLRTDRYKETVYLNEKNTLSVSPNGSYLVADTIGIPSVTQLVDERSTQHSIGKNRLDNIADLPPQKQSVSRHKHGVYGWVLLTEAEHEKLISDLGQAEFDRCITVVDESAQSSGNKNKWKDWNLVLRKCSRDKWGSRPVDNRQLTPPSTSLSNVNWGDI